MGDSAGIESSNGGGIGLEEVETCDPVECSSVERSNEIFEEAEMPSYSGIVPSPEDQLYHCAEPNCPSHGFATKSSLRSHMRSHIRPAKCRRCNYTGARKGDIVRHARANHRLWAQEKLGVCDVFICGVCKKPFTRSDNLKKHCKRKHRVPQSFC